MSDQEILAVIVTQGAAHSISTLCDGHPKGDPTGSQLNKTQDNFPVRQIISLKNREGGSCLLISGPNFPSPALCEDGVNVNTE